MEAMVRVWVDPELDVQHLALPPGDDTSKEWDGTTACGRAGRLRWIHGETVDRGASCDACMAAVGTTPPMEGDDPGPV